MASWVCMCVFFFRPLLAAVTNWMGKDFVAVVLYALWLEDLPQRPFCFEKGEESLVKRIANLGRKSYNQIFCFSRAKLDGAAK